MSIKNKVLAAAATMTMVGGVSAVGLLPAQAATPSCTGCGAYFSQQYAGTAPGFVLDVLRQGEKPNQPVILFRTSNSDPAEDFVTVAEGTVTALNTANAALLPPGLVSTYGADEAYEIEYAPYGVDSNLCVGTNGKAGLGTPVELEWCGVSSMTIWVVDGPANATPNVYYPWINGSSTNFDSPYALHYPGNSYPTDGPPRAVLNTYPLQQYSTGAVYNNEMWSGTNVVPPV